MDYVVTMEVNVNTNENLCDVVENADIKIIEEVVMDGREAEIIQSLTQQLEAQATNEETVIDEETTVIDDEMTVIDEEATVINEETTVINEETTVINEEVTVVNEEFTVIEEHVEEQVNAGQYVVTSTFQELKEIIDEYSEQTSSVFSVSRRAKHFGSPASECDLSKRSVMWEEIDGISTFTHEITQYNGIPFMVVGSYILQCQFGNDYSSSKKERRKKLKESGELVVSRSRYHAIPTKKCGCPAKVVAKQIIKFPEYELDKKTKYRKRVVNKQLKEKLRDDQANVKTEVYFIVHFPDIAEHKFHELLGDNVYGKEPVLKELKFMVQEMTLDFKSTSEILNKIYSYVENEMFYNKQPPDRSRRKYFPLDKDIRNISHRVRENCKFTDKEEQSMIKLVQRLEESQQCNFLFRLEEPSMDEALAISQSLDTSPKRKKLKKKICSAFVLSFQTPKQSLLLKKYGSTVYIVEVTRNTSATRVLSFRTHLIFVQTNVDFQLVGCFMASKQKLGGFVDCFNAFKSWNPSWAPKYFIVDYDERMVQAITSLFPDSDYYLDTEYCGRKWLEFLLIPSNELVGSIEDVMNFLKEVQMSYTQEALQEAASNMEKSDVWNSSEKLREWFQTDWLANAKQWVMEYRPHDLLMFDHGHDVMNECIKKVESLVSDTTKTSGKGAFINMVESMATTVSQKQYDGYVERNKDYYKQCFQFARLFPQYDIHYGIPLSMVLCLLRVQEDFQQNSYNIDPQDGSGIFKVSEVQTVEGVECIKQEVLVMFGDSNIYPRCSCLAWFRTRQPCAHMFTIFQSLPHWKYDALSTAYRVNNCLNIDLSCLDGVGVSDIDTTDSSCQSEVVHSVNFAMQKNTPDIIHKRENLSPPVTESFLMKLKEFSRQIDDMERIFNDKQCYELLSTNLSNLVNSVEKHLHWNKNSGKSSTNTTASLIEDMPANFVSMKSFLTPVVLKSNRNTPLQIGTVSVGLKSGICKTPVASKIVTNQKESHREAKESPLKDVRRTPEKSSKATTNNGIGYRSRLRNKTLTPIKKSGNEETPIPGNRDSSLEKPKTPQKILVKITTKKPQELTRNKRKLIVPVDVANAVNILTNSSINAKKVKTEEVVEKSKDTS